MPEKASMRINLLPYGLRINVMFRNVLIFLILCFGTIQAYCLVDRYHEIGGQLLANNDFSDGLQGWLVSGSTTAEVVAGAGLVRMKSQDGKSRYIFRRAFLRYYLERKLSSGGQSKRWA